MKKVKEFFSIPKGCLLELILMVILFGVNEVLAFTMPYYSVHKAYYDGGAYGVVLILVLLLCFLRLFLTKKKSAVDLGVILFAFFLLWEVSYKAGLVKNDLLIPSPEGLFHVFVEKHEELIKDVKGSINLLFFGYLLAVVLGTLLGLTAGWFGRIREITLPISNVITLIPPLMFSAYLIMILPTFRAAAIAVIFFAVFWPTFQGTVTGVGRIDRKVIEAARTMGVSNVGMLFKVIFPYCLPDIITSVSRSLRGAFMCLAGAEMLGMNLGIGYFVEKYKSLADYRCVLAGIVTVGIITTLADLLVGKLRAVLIRWKD
ncbi:MAG: ABC transporter permease subunit [Lachnospiraceae bacterium]|nr:ABC transporter permease subunit [Lachnospiraceae bacterium]